MEIEPYCYQLSQDFHHNQLATCRLNMVFQNIHQIHAVRAKILLNHPNATSQISLLHRISALIILQWSFHLLKFQFCYLGTKLLKYQPCLNNSLSSVKPLKHCKQVEKTRNLYIEFLHLQVDPSWVFEHPMHHNKRDLRTPCHP